MGNEEKRIQVRALCDALIFKHLQVKEFLAALERGTGAREMALVRTHLQEAYHWAEEAWIELEKEGEMHHNDQEGK